MESKLCGMGCQLYGQTEGVGRHPTTLLRRVAGAVVKDTNSLKAE
jgi:hypothetical protein